jgi:glutamyl-tRNA synthetase
MPQKPVITRFAPSPTGDLHIGGARTALFNYLFAKKNNGKFLLRIEDTDEKRSTQEAIDAILSGLDWLGLKHDEQYILQSKNISRHQEIAKKLIESGGAYYCYTSAEELESLRLEAEKKGEVFRFKSKWRDGNCNIQTTQTAPAIRIKAPIFGEIIIDDLVQGQVRVSASEIDDMVLLRSDGTATYMFAVVVDDHDMGITDIIRGDDHLNNAFRQKIIYELMGWEVPKFAHIPLIHGCDGAKMSKRHGAVSVVEYKKMGYLPSAMRNYLLRLGWSHGDAEIISDLEAVSWFNLEKVGRSPSRFDFAKLNHVNKHYLKEKRDEEIFDLLKDFFDRDLSSSEQNRVTKAIKFVKERSNTLKDLAKNLEVYFDDFEGRFDEEMRKILSEKKLLIVDFIGLIDGVENWNHCEIKDVLDKYTAAKALKIKDVLPALRIILTSSQSSAGGIFDIMEVLGKLETARRMRQITFFC